MLRDESIVDYYSAQLQQQARSDADRLAANLLEQFNTVNVKKAQQLLEEHQKGTDPLDLMWVFRPVVRLIEFLKGVF